MEDNKQEVFGTGSNPFAMLSGLGLLFLVSRIVGAIIRWKKVVAGWNQPADAKGDELDSEEDEG